MRTPRLGWWMTIPAALGAAALGMIPNTPAPSGPRATFEQAVVAGSPSGLRSQYRRWLERHEAGGGDRDVIVPLGSGRGFTHGRDPAAGAVRLDLVDGRVAATVNDLAPHARFDLWLVDNRPADGASVLLDPGDRRLLAGTVTTDAEGHATLEDTSLPELSSFEVDLVVGVPSGADPADAGVIFGVPRAFQRVYTRTRRGELTAYADGPSPILTREPRALDALRDALRPSSAHAASPLVDADVLFDAAVAAGAQLFMNETFGGNGRTCSTCHPPGNNFTLDPVFISKLPPNDPLFVAETNPALAGLENNELLRARALILEHLDGFDKPPVLRSVNHTLALATTIDAPHCDSPDDSGCTTFLPDGTTLHIPEGAQAPVVDSTTPDASGYPPVAFGPPPLAYPVQRTGWGGDGAPGSGSLREFAIGAIVQHLPRTLARRAGIDFRLPTDEQLDALELFQLSLGRSEEVDLRALSFNDPVVALGKELFTRTDTNFGTQQAGKCEVCHMNAGASSTPEVFGAAISNFGVSPYLVGNQVFQTGLSDLEFAPANVIAPGSAPRDGGFGRLAHGPQTCFTGTFDTSGPVPVFVPAPPSAAPTGYGSIIPPGIPLAGFCYEPFNPPPLVEAADTAPFFHDNSVDTIEQAVAFYATDTFNKQAPNQLFMQFVDSGFQGIKLDASGVTAIANFLRVLNAVENLRQARELCEAALVATNEAAADQLVTRALDELEDAREVLAAVKLHPQAILEIGAAVQASQVARLAPGIGLLFRNRVNVALDAIEAARDDMVTDL